MGGWRRVYGFDKGRMLMILGVDVVIGEKEDRRARVQR